MQDIQFSQKSNHRWKIIIFYYFIFFRWKEHNDANILLINLYSISPHTVQSNHHKREHEAFCLLRFTVKSQMHPKYSQNCRHHSSKVYNSLTKARFLLFIIFFCILDITVLYVVPQFLVAKKGNEVIYWI